MKATLTREVLFSKTQRRYKYVTVPTGEVARLQNLTTGEMRNLRNSLLDRKGDVVKTTYERLQQILVATCLVDDDGNLLITSAEAIHESFDAIDGAITTRLFAEAKLWTGFSTDSDWAAIEDAIKNSGGTTTNGSATA